jgi:hypothetical protein
MTPIQLLAILVLVGYAVIRQSRVSRAGGPHRFKLALTYAIVGLCIGGFDLPSGTAGVTLLVFGLVLSVVVGVFRGIGTRVWLAPDGNVLKRGTRLTVGLFLALIATKFVLGAWADAAHVDDGQGFGEVLAMIAAMLAVQAEIVHRRARRIARAPRPAPIHQTV